MIFDTIDEILRNVLTDFNMSYERPYQTSVIPYRMYADKNAVYLDILTPMNEDWVKVKLDGNTLSINVEIPKLDSKTYKVIDDSISRKYSLSFDINDNIIDIEKIQVKFKDMLHIELPRKESKKEKYIPIQKETKQIENKKGED